jgi:site-specific recombinase XerD
MIRARVSVIVPRHDADCEWKGGAEKNRKKCRCPKYLYEHISRLRTSARTKSWIEAEELAEARERALNGEDKPDDTTAPGGGHLLRDVIEEYLTNFRQLGKSVDHYEKAERWIQKRLLPWMTSQGITRLHEITRKHLRSFRATWRTEFNVSLISVQKATERMSSFFIWCVGEGYLPANPAYKLGTIKVPDPPEEFFEDHEIKTILDSVSCYALDEPLLRKKRSQIRLRTFIELMVGAGPRIIDASILERKALIALPGNRWRLHIPMLKCNGRIAVVPIEPRLAKLLQEVPGGDHPHPNYFFWTGIGDPETAAKDWWEKCSVVFKHAEIRKPDGTPKRCHPHMFRDTFAINCLKNSATLEQVQHMLGHKSIRTTEKHYGHWSTARHEHLHDQMEQIWSGKGKKKKAG